MSEELVFNEALSLSVEKRAELAPALLKSLDDAPPEDVEAAWASEIGRRMHEVETGSVQLDSWSGVKAQVQSKLAAK